MKVIRLPKLLTIGWSHVLFARFDDALRHAGPLTFDFQRTEWAAPFGLTTLSVVLEKCLLRTSEVYYMPPEKSALKSYLDRIGFRRHFLRGPDAAHKATSVELKRLQGVDPGCGEALVNLIAANFPLSEDAKYEIRAHLNELMTNSFDHGKTRLGFYVCAQWYPAKKNLRISFADGGIGILRSFDKSKKFPEVTTDIQAIRLAVKRGVTTRTTQLGGLGLDYIRKYVRRNNGTLSIVSGHGKVNFLRNKIENKYEPVAFEGTVVDVLVSPGDAAFEDKKNDLF
jgi:hypothetical protein